MLVYYRCLRSVFKTKPQFRRCLTRCRHCRIFFFTDPRNAGRRDLRCPFGCAEAHGKRESNNRSIAYNQSREGRCKKKVLNNKRKKPGAPVAPTAPAVLIPPTILAAPPVALPQTREPASWPVSVVRYVKRMTSWIEGRPVRVHEVLEMLAKVLRQRRMVRRRRIDQSVDWLNEYPP